MLPVCEASYWIEYSTYIMFACINCVKRAETIYAIVKQNNIIALLLCELINFMHYFIVTLFYTAKYCKFKLYTIRNEYMHNLYWSVNYQAASILIDFNCSPSAAGDLQPIETSILISDWSQITGLAWVATEVDKYNRSLSQ